MLMTIASMALAVGIIYITRVIWSLIAKRDDVDELNRVANYAATVLFWGVALAAVIVVLFFSN